MKKNTNTSRILNYLFHKTLIIAPFLVIPLMIRTYSDLKVNPDIKGTYLKTDNSNVSIISQHNKDPKFICGTLENSKSKIKIEKLNFIMLDNVELPSVKSLKVKGLSGNNYYIVDNKQAIKDNKVINIIKLSQVNSNILKTLMIEPEKEIIVNDDLSHFTKNTIVTLSSDNKITTTTNVPEKIINYKVKKNTYYLYPNQKTPLTKRIKNLVDAKIVKYLERLENKRN